jgi:hypothetical protein
MPKPFPAGRRVSDCLPDSFVRDLPIVFLAGLFIVRVLSFPAYRWLVSEDGVLESLQFVFYFLTGSLLWLRGWRLRKRANLLALGYCFLLGGALLFLSLEEISWGQRLFGFANPAIFAANNVQQEVSVHNLSTVQPFLHGGYIAVGLLWGGLLPLARYLPLSKGTRRYLPDWNFSGYFLPLSLVYLILSIFPPASSLVGNRFGFIWRDQEVVETLLALGLFLLHARVGPMAAGSGTRAYRPKI